MNINTIKLLFAFSTLKRFSTFSWRTLPDDIICSKALDILTNGSLILFLCMHFSY